MTTLPYCVDHVLAFSRTAHVFVLWRCAAKRMSESGTLFRSRGLRVRLVQYKSLNLGVLPIAGLRQKGLTSRQSRDYDRCIVHITWVAALDALHVCFIALVNRLYDRHLGVLMQQGIDYSPVLHLVQLPQGMQFLLLFSTICSSYSSCSCSSSSHHHRHPASSSRPHDRTTIFTLLLYV